MPNRRSFLATLGGSALLSSCSGVGMFSDERADIHQALVYARDNKLSYWSLQGQKFGAIDGDLVHLWDIETVIAATSSLEPDGTLRARVFETFYVFHPDSREVLSDFDNPFTGTKTSFPSYPARPVDQEYPAARFEKETQTPVGLMTASTAISVPNNATSVTRLDIEKEIRIARSTGSPMRIHEFMTYTGARATFDPAYGFVTADLDLTIWSDWLPWMQMDHKPGGLFTRARGRKLQDLAELPVSATARIAADFPTLLDDPRTFLNAA